MKPGGGCVKPQEAGLGLRSSQGWALRNHCCYLHPRRQVPSLTRAAISASSAKLRLKRAGGPHLVSRAVSGEPHPGRAAPTPGTVHEGQP